MRCEEDDYENCDERITGRRRYVTDNFPMYREKIKDMPDIEPVQDGLSTWRGTKMLWRVDFPADAGLHVAGDEIYAVTKTMRGFMLSKSSSRRASESKSTR